MEIKEVIYIKPLSEKLKLKRLKEKNIIIEEKFLRNYNDKKTIISYRTSDGSKNDKIYNSIKLEKKFFYNNKCIYTEKDFDKNVYYSFVFDPNSEITKCHNCGYSSKSSEFIDGCPYCGTNFNIDFNLKNYGGATIKEILNEKKFRFALFVIPLIIILPIFITLDYPIIIKILYSLMMYPIFYFISYFLLTLLIINPLVIYRSIKNNNVVGIWNVLKRKNLYIEQKNFYNCINTELLNYYFNNDNYTNLIDFDIYKYKKIKLNNIEESLPIIFVSVIIRKYYFINNKIKIVKKNRKFLIKYNTNKINLKNNSLECWNCGASIDLTKDKCDYCNTPINKKNDWYIYKFLK